MPRLGLPQRLWGLVTPEVLHLVLQGKKGLSPVGELPELRPDLIGGAGQFGVALGSLLAAGRDELGAVGCVAVDQLLFLRNLCLVGRDQLSFLEFRADALGDLRDGLSLAIAREAMARRAVLQQFGKVQCTIACVIRMGLEDHALDLPKQAIRETTRRAEFLDEPL